MWIESHYPAFLRLIEQGAWMQVTAGALTGQFGARAKYWGERFIGEGHTHILATDAHSTGRRKPQLSAAMEMAETALGKELAMQLVLDRPDAVLNDKPPSQFALTPQYPSTISRLRRWREKWF